MVLPGWGSGYPTMTSEDEGVGFLRVELGKFALPEVKAVESVCPDPYRSGSDIASDGRRRGFYKNFGVCPLNH